MIEMYQELVLDHYKNPRNFGEIANATIKSRDSNISCGDQIEVFLKLNKNKIEDIKFKGGGCAIMIASASLLSETIKDRNLNDVIKMNKDDLFKLFDNNISPVRIKCVMLPFSALKSGVFKYLGKEYREEQ